MAASWSSSGPSCNASIGSGSSEGRTRWGPHSDRNRTAKAGGAHREADRFTRRRRRSRAKGVPHIQGTREPNDRRRRWPPAVNWPDRRSWPRSHRGGGRGTDTRPAAPGGAVASSPTRDPLERAVAARRGVPDPARAELRHTSRDGSARRNRTPVGTASVTKSSATGDDSRSEDHRRTLPSGAPKPLNRSHNAARRSFMEVVRAC